MDPWLLELIVVKNGSYGGAERGALSRDVARGLLHRVRPGVYVEAAAWQAIGVVGRHVVAMRALDAVAPARPGFSHWSAAVVHGLPFIGRRLDRVHVTVGDAAMRGLSGVAGHVLLVRDEEVADVRGLLVTRIGRTVVDVTAASSFEDGVVIADAALAAGLPREMLEAAVDLAGPRQARRRLGEVTAFASPGGESPNESRSRTSCFRLGVEVCELQVEIHDEQGLAGVLDTYWRRLRIGGEADGRSKYLDPRLAKQGAGKVVYDEKLREDRVRARIAGLARWGWEESCSPPLLRPVLARVGIVPLERRPSLEDWARVAREARPRRPRWSVTV